MSKRRESDEYIDLDDILEKIKRSKIPALSLDIRWQSLFDFIGKSGKIIKLEKKVNEVMKSRGRINTDKSDLKKVKKKLMQEIMINMDSPESSRANKKVMKSRELIEEINDKLILLEDEELDIPDKLKEANAELALETMSEIFDKYEDNCDDIESLNQWINDTRIELKKRVLLLEKKKEENEKMDKYLSDLLDGEIIREYRKYREQEE